MDHNIDLSIIIPVYNGAKYLKDLISSLLKIANISAEFIFVDDGSADESAACIRHYEKNDKRIRYMYKENGGIVSARNYGLNSARGNYLFFADQDDKIVAQTISEIVIQMAETKADIAFFSTKCFNDLGKEWECDQVYSNEVFYRSDVENIFLRKLITRKERGKQYISYIGHIWGAIISRNLINHHGITFKCFMAIEDDLLFVLDALDCAEIVQTSAETGYYWRNNPFSETRAWKYTENLPDKMKVYYQYRTDILDKHHICTQEERIEYLTGMQQEYILNLINNEFMYGVAFHAEKYKMLQQVMTQKDSIIAVRSQPICPMANKCKIELWLLKRRWLMAVIIYKKTQSFKRFIINQIRKRRMEE